jgi:hypothetical protein
MIPGTKTRVKAGGYVKLDLIHDFKPIESPDFFDVSKIPTDGSEGESTHLNVKETRLLADVRSPLRAGEIKMYVEGDFYGSGGAFRIRHAYAEIGGKLLAGQTWSNFMDEDIIPNTLDFEKPAAYAFVRHPLVRYRHQFSESTYLAVAVEEPSTNAQAPPQPGEFESPLPDLTARVRLSRSWGHVQASGFAGKLTYRYTAGGKEEVALFGCNLSGAFNLLKKDRLSYQVLYGPGAARFRGGLSAAVDANGNLEALTDIGVSVMYQHQWSKAFTSVLVLNQGSVDNLSGQPVTSLSLARYTAANLIWSFADNAFAGVEYLWGERQDIDGSNGTAGRLQFSVRYGF